MGTITIESEAFQDLVGRINRISDYVIQKEVSGESGDKEVWLNSREAASLLRVSMRTLQRLRSNNQIIYSILRGRCLYRRSTIERMLDERSTGNEQSVSEEFQNNRPE